ncbi:MAG: RNA methyltransferase [Gammaproteobacteria bacterium]|nr:RNA methyltransferase [Gammaproteobacteria bacterium]
MQDTDELLARIRVILVRTYHPGNIGSAARSMKTMGLSDLCLVQPRDFPSIEATRMAAGAADLVNHARCVDDLASAVADCTTVIASTARPRGYDLPELSPQAAARLLLEQSTTAPVALIFGPERMGLHNKDMQHARYRVTIPANPDYNSLNMAAAVQTLSYEIFKAAGEHYQGVASTKPERQLPTTEDLERLHVHLETVLREIQFLRPHEGETLQRLRNLISRAEPDQLDANILRGILSAIQKSANNQP